MGVWEFKIILSIWVRSTWNLALGRELDSVPEFKVEPSKAVYCSVCSSGTLIGHSWAGLMGYSAWILGWADQTGILSLVTRFGSLTLLGYWLFKTLFYLGTTTFIYYIEWVGVLDPLIMPQPIDSTRKTSGGTTI